MCEEGASNSGQGLSSHLCSDKSLKRDSFKNKKLEVLLRMQLRGPLCTKKGCVSSAKFLCGPSAICVNDLKFGV